MTAGDKRPLSGRRLLSASTDGGAGERAEVSGQQRETFPKPEIVLMAPAGVCGTLVKNSPQDVENRPLITGLSSIYDFSRILMKRMNPGRQKDPFAQEKVASHLRAPAFTPSLLLIVS